MLTTSVANQTGVSGETVPALAFWAYLAGLTAAGTLIVSAAVVAALGLQLVFG